jgi:hypothetical protein
MEVHFGVGVDALSAALDASRCNFAAKNPEDASVFKWDSSSAESVDDCPVIIAAI